MHIEAEPGDRLHGRKPLPDERRRRLLGGVEREGREQREARAAVAVRERDKRKEEGELGRERVRVEVGEGQEGEGHAVHPGPPASAGTLDPSHVYQRRRDPRARCAGGLIMAAAPIDLTSRNSRGGSHDFYS